MCLDTGHCVYGYGDSVKEAEKYKSKLRFVHIKDCDTRVLEEARRNKWTFEEAMEHKVFTVIGQGNIDFPAFFPDAGEERLFGMVGGGAGREIRRDANPTSAKCGRRLARGVKNDLEWRPERC